MWKRRKRIHPREIPQKINYRKLNEFYDVPCGQEKETVHDVPQSAAKFWLLFVWLWPGGE